VGVTNTGTLAANVTSVTSTVPADFVVVDDNCSGQPLAIGAACTFGAIFTPAKTGALSASIKVVTDVAGTGTIAASGTGVAALTSTTTLAANPASAAFGGLFTLTASVVDSTSAPVTVGSVSFYNGAALLGTAQIVGTTSGGGVVGTAIYRTRFLPLGADSITAKYTGPDATSTSAATTVTVTGKYPSTTTLAAAGVQGSYVLTGTVLGGGPVPPTGNLVFTDQQTSTTLGGGSVALDPTTLTLNFAQGTPETVPLYAYQPVVGDLNGDGIPDLVEVVNGSGVAVLLGNGDGTFQPASSIPIGAGVTYLAMGDFNGDGKLDLAVSLAATGYPPLGSIEILLGNGDGTFTSVANSPAVGIYC